MTTWTTFETIDESQNWDEFYIDRLGVHQYAQDERTRFQLMRTFEDAWRVVDLEALEDAEDIEQISETAKVGSMREVIQWVAGRTLYGA